MQIEIQLFSILRECLPVRGRGDPAQGQMVTVPDGATLADLVASLGIDRRLGCSATELSTAGRLASVRGRQARIEFAVRACRRAIRCASFHPFRVVRSGALQQLPARAAALSYRADVPWRRES